MSDSDKIWMQLGGERDRKSLSTKTRQIKVTDFEKQENKVYSPVIYQSCMNPENIHIYDLKVKKISAGQWMVETHYQTDMINLKSSDLQVSGWKPEIHKVDCKKCENCGRCGW